MELVLQLTWWVSVKLCSNSVHSQISTEATCMWKWKLCVKVLPCIGWVRYGLELQSSVGFFSLNYVSITQLILEPKYDSASLEVCSPNIRLKRVYSVTWGTVMRRKPPGNLMCDLPRVWKATKGLIIPHCIWNDNKLLAAFPILYITLPSAEACILLVMLLICALLGRGQDLIEIIRMSLLEVAEGL